MRRNFVRARLQEGKPSIGTWLTAPDPMLARLMARVGFDWLNVEMEHTPVSFETAALSFGNIADGGCAPLARVPWNTGENIKRVLDCGAWGVVVPMVNSRAEAEQVVDWARYHPQGSRSVGGQLHAVNFDTTPAEYYERANDEVLVVVMAEHVRAVEACEEILSVPGVDAVFIGPNDLLKSMGKAPRFDSDEPEFIQALEHVRTTARAKGVASGIHVLSPESAKQRIDEGFQFISIGSEVGLMLAKAREVVDALEMGRGETGIKY